MGRIPENIQLLHNYWTSLAGSEAPERARFEIEHVRAILPYLMICEFTWSPFRVRYRLSGTAVDEMTGVNLTGRYLDEFSTGRYAASVKQMLDYYAEASRTGHSRIWSYPWAGYHGSKSIWAGIFPLRVNGKICQCVAIEDYGKLNENPTASSRDAAACDWASLPGL